MKLGFFTDSHYSTAELTDGNRFNNQSLRKIKEAYTFFEREKCDLVICLGDLIDHEASHDQEITNLTEVADVVKASPLRTIVVMGNHDGFSFEVDEFYQILGEACRPCSINIEGKHLIFLDTCYFKNGAHYMPGDTDWTDTFYPHADALKKQLSTLFGDTYLFMHQNIDPSTPANHQVYNGAELREIIESEKNVKGVFQGHYHLGQESEYHGISYTSFRAMCQYEDAFWTIEL